MHFKMVKRREDASIIAVRRAVGLIFSGRQGV